MPYRLNREVRAQDFVRHHIPEHKYIDDLRERGLLLDMGNILVDAEQLVLRTFQCNTNYCVRCTGSNSTREYKGSCCTDLMVDVTPDEKARLRELAEHAKRDIEFTPNDPVARIVDLVLRDRFSEVNEDGEEELLHRKNGACVMSWIDGSGQLRCSINTLVYKLGLSIEEYKPAPCYVFPLHYAEVGVDQFIITLLTEETRGWIQQDKAVTRLRCLKTPEPGSPPTYQFLRGELEFMLGKSFYRDLDQLARPILERFHAGEYDTMFMPAQARGRNGV